ncbi:MAG: hypothetical protein NVSMB42_09170 [Herpetosiphon sp.]
MASTSSVFAGHCRVTRHGDVTALRGDRLAIRGGYAAGLLVLARRHWQIETGLPYRRDDTLHADTSLVRRGRAPQLLASLNNTVLGRFAQGGWRNVASALRMTTFQLARALARLLDIPIVGRYSINHNSYLGNAKRPSTANSMSPSRWLRRLPGPHRL